MDEKQCIARVQLADGSVYEIKDEYARELLNSFFTEELILDCGGAPSDAV